MEELIDKYFEKSLSDQELLTFEQKLASDPDFKEEFEFQNSLKQALYIKERSDLKNMVSNFEKPKKKRIWWINAAAAAIILLLGITVFNLFLKAPSHAELYASYYQTYPNVIAPNVRGENQDQLKAKAFKAYDTGNFAEATLIFAELKSQSAEEYPIFYEGISYLELNEPEKTISLFENTVFNAKNTSFEYLRKWYLSLAYLKTGKIDLAKKTLIELSKNENIYQQQAIKLLKEL